MTKAQYSVLVLTDHRGHSEHNSIYALLQQMRLHERCQRIAIASRGSASNQAFFSNAIDSPLYASAVEADFAFAPDGGIMLAGEQGVDPEAFDIIFLRLPRPVSDTFLEQLAQRFHAQLIVNNPIGILKTSNKAFLLECKEACPPIRLVRSVEEAKAFAALFPIVLKPLREYGGRGLVKIDGDTLDDGQSLHDTTTYLQSLETILKEDGMLAMKFLKNVSQGDKRIIVVGGEIMASSLRLPAADSWLCNVAQGGTSVAGTVTPEEEEIVATIHPKLKAAGVLIYGVDTLVDDDGRRVLSEINTLSIGGFPQAERQQGRPVIRPTLDKIFQNADEHYAG